MDTELNILLEVVWTATLTVREDSVRYGIGFQSTLQF